MPVQCAEMESETGARYATEILNIGQNSSESSTRCSSRVNHGDGRVRHAACIHDDASPYLHGASADLPKALHPVSMPGALREDCDARSQSRATATFISGPTRVASASYLPGKIARVLEGSRPSNARFTSSRTCAPTWGSRKLVLDGVRSSGIIRVAFLVDQRHSDPSHNSRRGLRPNRTAEAAVPTSSPFASTNPLLCS